MKFKFNNPSLFEPPVSVLNKLFNKVIPVCSVIPLPLPIVFCINGRRNPPRLPNSPNRSNAFKFSVLARSIWSERSTKIAGNVCICVQNRLEIGIFRIWCKVYTNTRTALTINKNGTLIKSFIVRNDDESNSIRWLWLMDLLWKSFVLYIMCVCDVCFFIDWRNTIILNGCNIHR